jgi:hypothetical protein
MMWFMVGLTIFCFGVFLWTAFGKGADADKRTSVAVVERRAEIARENRGIKTELRIVGRNEVQGS